MSGDERKSAPVIVKLSGHSEGDLQALVDTLIMHPALDTTLQWGPNVSTDRLSYDAILSVVMRNPMAPYSHLRALTDQEKEHGLKQVLFKRDVEVEVPVTKTGWWRQKE